MWKRYTKKKKKRKPTSGFCESKLFPVPVSVLGLKVKINQETEKQIKETTSQIHEVNS